MLKKITTKLPDFLRRSRYRTETALLENLSSKLGSKIKGELLELSKFTEGLTTTEVLHLAIDNLTNAKSAVKNVLRQKELLNPEVAVTLLDEQIEETKKILPILEHSEQAMEISLETLNLLFCTKQAVKEQFAVTTSLILPVMTSRNANFPASSEKMTGNNAPPVIPQLLIPSTLVYQMHHSLFPAEKMLVGAGHRVGADVMIDAVFEVTGEASSGHVWADRAKLARSLISMSETDSYFALWVHSHPGDGAEMTRPSGTDLKQENDWLKDYSATLVNAIMVKDGFIRFWGKAIENNLITVSITGTGVKKLNNNVFLYQLES